MSGARERIEAIRARAERATAGPWRWEVSLRSHNVQLCGGNPRFDLTVMDFVRWGMSCAAPRFLKATADKGLMLLERVEHWAHPVPGREHHAEWFRAIQHPDAQFISESRTDVPALCAALLDVLAYVAGVPSSPARGEYQDGREQVAEHVRDLIDEAVERHMQERG
jgi:hypothetical protein